MLKLASMLIMDRASQQIPPVWVMEEVCWCFDEIPGEHLNIVAPLIIL